MSEIGLHHLSCPVGGLRENLGCMGGHSSCEMCRENFEFHLTTIILQSAVYISVPSARRYNVSSTYKTFF